MAARWVAVDPRLLVNLDQFSSIDLEVDAVIGYRYTPDGGATPTLLYQGVDAKAKIAQIERAIASVKLYDEPF
jgi:hypothetical protein